MAISGVERRVRDARMCWIVKCRSVIGWGLLVVVLVVVVRAGDEVRIGYGIRLVVVFSSFGAWDA